MKSRFYFYLGSLLLIFVYYVNTKSNISDANSLSAGVDILRDGSGLLPDRVIANVESGFRRLQFNKPLKIKISKDEIKPGASSVDCEPISEDAVSAFLKRHASELEKVIGLWYFDKVSAPNKLVSAMSDTEKFFFALASSDLLYGKLGVSKNVQLAKETLLNLYNSNSENSSALLPLYYLETNVEKKKEYYIKTYYTKNYIIYLEDIYKKLFSLVETGEDFLTAEKIFFDSPRIKMGYLYKTIELKKSSYIAWQLVEAGLDENNKIKNKATKTTYKAGKISMDNYISKNNYYPDYVDLVTASFEEKAQLRELKEACDYDGVWSLVHDEIKTKFR